jgi:phosphate transport system permease protein
MTEPTLQAPARRLDVADSRHRWRMLKDRMARHGVAFGGISVIIAIVLIFFYLLYVVFPLFIPATSEAVADYALPGEGKTLYLEMEEHAGIAVRYTDAGRAIFFDTTDGSVLGEAALAGLEGRRISSVAKGIPGSHQLALGLSDGGMLVVQHKFAISYPNDVRTVTPTILYPYGEAPLEVAAEGMALNRLAMSDGEDLLLIAATDSEGRLHVVKFHKETSLLDEEVSLEREGVVLEDEGVGSEFLRLEPSQRHLYLAAARGELLHYDVSGDEAHLQERVQLTPKGQRLSSLELLVGGYSLLAGSDKGEVIQWFPVRDEHNNYKLTRIRDFSSQQQGIVSIATEERRKGFLAADASGRIGIYHATAHRTILLEQVATAPIVRLSNAPRSNAFLAEDGEGRLHFWHVHNEHPEISWSSLWGKVHYEGYDKPNYTWQSSSASNDFEPKFSLTPLAFGTLKAAFYAMLIAVPLAILGAIYTAYFMAPRMRQVVKPTIEIMEALPTVILGFLAGLWLAPVLENHLPAIFVLLMLMPLAVLLFGFAVHSLPRDIRARIPEGWEAAMLIPVLIGVTWFSFATSLPLENFLFGGDMRSWLSNEMGIGYDQRNSLVVGIAMGFAVIPTIFSIAEDAIFSVPKHLTFGSLALGATPWQTMVRVVILTASPGIFSAVMIGMGRAVGETMIVLMATGNTPVMDFSIFQGMRTLSANIAVEMPESEVASTHYRILFLAALVLFMFTFVFNTLAEIVRQRLRRKYSNL